jgi:hypothetical protein
MLLAADAVCSFSAPISLLMWPNTSSESWPWRISKKFIVTELKSESENEEKGQRLRINGV